MVYAIRCSHKKKRLTFALEPPVEKDKHFRLVRVVSVLHELRAGKGWEGAWVVDVYCGVGGGNITCKLHLADFPHRLRKRTGPCMDLCCGV